MADRHAPSWKCNRRSIWGPEAMCMGSPKKIKSHLILRFIITEIFGDISRSDNEIIREKIDSNSVRGGIMSLVIRFPTGMMFPVFIAG